MSDETKTVLLKVQIDQQQALTTLQDTNAKILGLKNQVNELNKEYKAGKVTQDEYVKSKTDLDLKIQQETKSRSILQQAVQAENNSLGAQKALLADLINQRSKIDQSTVEGAQKAQALTGRIKELNDSMMNVKKHSGGLTESFLKFAEGARIGELELGKVAGLLPLIASPATAAAAAITALGAAYASSAAGSKDLEEAQNRLKAQWEVLAGSVGGEISEGEGLMAKITRYAIGIGKGFTAAAADAITLGQFDFIKDAEVEEKVVDKVTKAYNTLKELQFEQLQNQVKAEEQRKEAFEETEKRANASTLEGRVEAARKVVELQKSSVEGSVEALKKQAQQLLIIGELTNNDVQDQKNISKLREAYLQLLVQIKSEESARQRRISSAVIEEQKLTKELEKQNEQKRIDASRTKPTLSEQELHDEFQTGQNKNRQSEKANIKKFENNLLKKAYDEDKNNYQTYLENKARIEKEKEHDHELLVKKRIQTDQAIVQAQKGFNDLARVTFGQNSQEYKAFATSQAIAATYAAADKALEIYGPTPVGYAAMAATIAEGLANAIQINKAAGGGTFETKGPTMLLVGDNPGGRERIDVTPLSGKGETVINPSSNLIAMAGGGSLYANGGGLVSSEMSSSINSEVAMQNALKNMPQPTVSWKEGLIVNSRIQVKEKLTSA